MPTMFEALTQMGANSVDPVKVSQINSQFTRDLPSIVQKVASDYLNSNISLNTSIAKVATERNLNEEQTQRVIAEANNQVYMTKFASMKNLNDRRVDFELASKQGVYNAQHPETLEKKASVNSMDFDDYSGKYRYDNLTPAKSVDYTKIAAKKIATELDTLDAGIKKQASVVADDLMNSAYALLRFEAIVPGSAQNAFNEMCKTAGVSSELQLLYKRAMEEKAGIMKKAHSIPDNTKTELKLCDIFEKTASFSLGKFSLQEKKEAYPSVKTDTGVIIDGVTGLCKIAEDFKNHMEKLAELQQERKSLEKEVSEVLDIQ